MTKTANEIVENFHKCAQLAGAARRSALRAYGFSTAQLVLGIVIQFASRPPKGLHEILSTGVLLLSAALSLYIGYTWSTLAERIEANSFALATKALHMTVQLGI